MMGTKYSLQCRILERSNPLLTALLVKSAPLPSGFSAVTASENAGYLYNSNEDYGDNVHDPEENQHALIWRRNVARRRDWQFGTVK